MSENTHFPEYPETELTREEVIDFLIQLEDNGWSIYEKNGVYIIIEDKHYKLCVREVGSSKWRIYTDYTGPASRFKHLDQKVSSARELRQVIEGRLGDESPSEIRLQEGEPMSNRAHLVSLIEPHRIEAVFDPCLDNKGLETIRTLCTLGVSLKEDLRMITSAPERITEDCFRSLIQQFNLENCEIRSTEGEHRRFMVLDSSDVLIIGCSLNDIDKNEVAFLEGNPEDRRFFEDVWSESDTAYSV